LQTSAHALTILHMNADWRGHDGGAQVYSPLSHAPVLTLSHITHTLTHSLTLQIDADMMAELKSIKGAVRPTDTLLVVDAMTGQEAANLVKAFNDEVDISGGFWNKALMWIMTGIRDSYTYNYWADASNSSQPGQGLWWWDGHLRWVGLQAHQYELEYTTGIFSLQPTWSRWDIFRWVWKYILNTFEILAGIDTGILNSQLLIACNLVKAFNDKVDISGGFELRLWRILNTGWNYEQTLYTIHTPTMAHTWAGTVMRLSFVLFLSLTLYAVV
jgi:hypothetical protein